MRISGVMPIHNEASFLPLSLESLRLAPLSELIIILDNVSDSSKEIIEYFEPSYPVHVYEKNWRKWKNPIAEVANYGFSLTTGKIVYSLFADLTYDLKLFSLANLSLFRKYDMVSFQYYNMDLNTNSLRVCYENMLARSYDKFGQVWKGAIFGTKKEVWQKLNGFHDTPSLYGENIQFQDYKERLEKIGGKYKHIKSTQNIHLRDTSLTKATQLKEGKGRCINNYPLWRVVIHSFLHLKPYVLIGYLRQKNEYLPY